DDACRVGVGPHLRPDHHGRHGLGSRVHRPDEGGGRLVLPDVDPVHPSAEPGERVAQAVAEPAAGALVHDDVPGPGPGTRGERAPVYSSLAVTSRTTGRPATCRVPARSVSAGREPLTPARSTSARTSPVCRPPRTLTEMVRPPASRTVCRALTST